jgi:hypothetical protein
MRHLFEVGCEDRHASGVRGVQRSRTGGRMLRTPDPDCTIFIALGHHFSK